MDFAGWILYREQGDREEAAFDAWIVAWADALETAFQGIG